MKGKKFELRSGLFGSAVGLLAVLAASAFFAWLVDREILAVEQIGLAGAGALIFGGLLVGLCGGRGEERWLRAGIGAGGLILGLLLISLIGFDGALDGLLPCAGLVLGSAAAGALVTGGGKGRNRRKYQIKKYRTG